MRFNFSVRVAGDHRLIDMAWMDEMAENVRKSDVGIGDADDAIIPVVSMPGTIDEGSISKLRKKRRRFFLSGIFLPFGLSFKTEFESEDDVLR
jgi:hypothetical protein